MHIDLNQMYDISQFKTIFELFFFEYFAYLTFFSYLCIVEQKQCVRTQSKLMYVKIEYVLIKKGTLKVEKRKN